MSLTSKLTAIFVLLSIVPLSLVGYLAYVDGRQTIEQGVIDRLLTTTLLKEAEFVEWLGDGERDIRALAQRPLVRVYAAVLAAATPDDPEYQNFLDLSLIRVSDGVILVFTNPQLKGKYWESEEFFVAGRTETYVGEVTYEITQGGQVMHISTPVTGENGAVIAVLAGHLNLAEISDIMTRRSGLRETEETYLVNTFNFMVTESRFEPDASLRRAVYTQGVNDCLAHHS